MASAIRLNTGPETGPPVVGPLRGESVTTMIATTGFREGTNPTNDALYSEVEYTPLTSLAAVPVLPAMV